MHDFDLQILRNVDVRQMNQLNYLRSLASTTDLKFLGVREFKEKLTGLLGKKEEVAVTRHGKPIARVVPVTKGSPEDLLLEIGMVLKFAGHCGRDRRDDRTFGSETGG